MAEKIKDFITKKYESLADNLDVSKVNLANCFLDKEKEHLMPKFKEQCSVIQAQLDILDELQDIIY